MMDMNNFAKTFKYICNECGNFSRIRSEFCGNCGAQALRKAKKNDYAIYEKIKNANENRMAGNLIGELQIGKKIMGIMDRIERLLKELVENHEDYKKLLKSKEAGGSVEDLIKKNRYTRDILLKEYKENEVLMKKWRESKEGKKSLVNAAMWHALNPDSALLRQTKELKINLLSIIIKENKEEYENLLERKNKGEFVDDLINQNRYTAEILEKDKKDSEKIMNGFTTKKKSGLKSRIKK